jgi:hypothetical protein
VGSKHLWRPAGPGRLAKHSLDLTVSDQVVEMKPDGIGMDAEPIGNLGDADGGVRRVDQFCNQLSPARQRYGATLALSPRAVKRMLPAIATCSC